jgi:hypothetical protein
LSASLNLNSDSDKKRIIKENSFGLYAGGVLFGE